jgi:YHS domain-containing protein
MAEKKSPSTDKAAGELKYYLFMELTDSPDSPQLLMITPRDMHHRTESNSLLVPAPDASEEQLAFPETVCHRTIRGDPAYYPQADFHGRRIYFCAETCQSVFLSDPDRFYAAHSKSRP